MRPQLKKTPGFTLVWRADPGTGIGANTAVFSVMNAVLLRSLPVSDPNRVVYLRTSNPPRRTGTIDSQETFSYAVYDALRRQDRGLSPLIAYVPLLPARSQSDMAYSRRSGRRHGERHFFLWTGYKVARGTALPSRTRATTHPLRDQLQYWTSRFARDRIFWERRWYVNGDAFTIVGVPPRDLKASRAALD